MLALRQLGWKTIRIDDKPYPAEFVAKGISRYLILKEVIERIAFIGRLLGELSQLDFVIVGAKIGRVIGNGNCQHVDKFCQGWAKSPVGVAEIARNLESSNRVNNESRSRDSPLRLETFCGCLPVGRGNFTFVVQALVVTLATIVIAS